MSKESKQTSLLKTLLRMVGKSYEPDPRIPLSMVLSEIFRRVPMLIKGILRLHAKVFVGRSVKVRGKKHLKIGAYSTIGDMVSIEAYSAEGLSIGENCKIGSFTTIQCTSHFSVLGKGLKMGSGSSIADFGSLGCAGGISIGRGVIAGQYCSFHSQEHNYDDLDTPIKDQGVSHQGITIEDDVWIGAKVTILDGTVIGSHSVIAAGSVVKGKFPPNSVIGGVPAKIIKQLSN